MKLLILVLALFTKPNEIRQFTHINDKNYVLTEIIILHSQGVMFIPDQKGITQKWEFKSIGKNSYEIKQGEIEGVISFTNKSAIMRVEDRFVYFTNKRMAVIKSDLLQSLVRQTHERQ